MHKWGKPARRASCQDPGWLLFSIESFGFSSMSFNSIILFMVVYQFVRLAVGVGFPVQPDQKHPSSNPKCMGTAFWDLHPALFGV